MIFNISSLRVIDLSSNDLYCSLPVDVCSHYVPKLERIYLPFNRFEGRIPSNLYKCKELQYLSLAFNEFSGSIPMEIGNLTRLKQLYLGYNNLEGKIPSSLWECRGLQLLLLADNKLIGSISKNIGNLTSLKNLHLSDNNLTGTLPGEISNLNLQILFLDGNNLSGRIPFEIFNISTIIDIALSMNQFSSPLPSSMGLWIPNLQRLYLGRNRLSGSFPNFISNASKFTMIEVSSNSFSGSIPNTLGNLIDLEWLMIGENNLTKEVSTPELRFFNALTNYFSLNQFSGVIPSTIASGQMLTFLSLVHNKLQGSIPQSLGNLVSLELLDLSINNLSGPIPMSLERLRYLQYFNASFNRLQGEIPTGYLDYMSSHATVEPSKDGGLEFLKYILPPIVAMILVVALIFVLMRHRKRGTELRTQMSSLPYAWRRFSYAKLLQATNGFRESNLLGVGGVGSVYKGILSEEVNVAVKVFNLQLDEAFKSFDVECGVLRNIRHRKLTKIVSSCSNLDFIALVLEYMSNGSLEKWLYSYNYCLTILEGLNIMIDVASALEYLHHGQTTPILHCDLKPINVLLDKDMIANVCDFGIAKLLGEDEFMAQIKTLATIGYMAIGNLPSLLFQLLL
ncbi:hypothetical protein LguiA_004648 [Lonicera macranthoides]